MTGHLCLKWNNHSSAFVHSLSNIQTKEKYCDATIICQGQYFSVHRVVLSTCSEYFEDMFERIQCQHPYIVFKDVEPNEMELLLNYMYQGEVNVVQESLPNLIKAAEALKIKGLAVPDDIPSGKDSSSRKRSNPNSDSSAPKRRGEERRRKTNSPTASHNDSEISEQQQNNVSTLQDTAFENLGKSIKQEPEEVVDFVRDKVQEHSKESYNSEVLSSFSKDENIFVEIPAGEMKTESGLPQSQSNVPGSSTGTFEDQPLNWSEFSNCNEEEISSDIPNQDNIYKPKIMQSNFTSLTSNFASSSQECVEEYSSTSGQSSNQETLTYLGASFRCSMCGHDCISVKELRQHVRLYHKDRKSFSCPLCNKAFVTKQHFQRHLLIHTGERPYTCPRCLKGFRVQHHLKNHLNKKLQCVRSEF